MIPIFRGKIERGKIQLDYPEKYIVWLSKLEGKRIEITVRERTTRRSDSQNRYYFGIVLPIISDNIGYEKDECHEALKRKFLSSPEDEIGLVKTKSTAKLSVDEFTQYVNKIVRWAAEYLRCYIPSPGDVDVYNHENM